MTPDELRFWELAAAAYAASGELPCAAAAKATLLVEQRRKVMGGTT